MYVYNLSLGGRAKWSWDSLAASLSYWVSPRSMRDSAQRSWVEFLRMTGFVIRPLCTEVTLGGPEDDTSEGCHPASVLRYVCERQVKRSDTWRIPGPVPFPTR